MLEIELNKILLDEQTQSRISVNQDTIYDYVEELKSGANFPAVILFKDKNKYYIGDGWHRVLAHKKLKRKTIKAIIKKGSKRKAILYSVGSNSEHGLRRTNEDKRNAVKILLNDKEWSSWSNRELAKQAAVTEGLVRKIKKELNIKTNKTTNEKSTITNKQINKKNNLKENKPSAKDKVESKKEIQTNNKQTTQKIEEQNISNTKNDTINLEIEKYYSIKRFKFFKWIIEIKRLKN